MAELRIFEDEEENTLVERHPFGAQDTSITHAYQNELKSLRRALQPFVKRQLNEKGRTALNGMYTLIQKIEQGQNLQPVDTFWARERHAMFFNLGPEVKSLIDAYQARPSLPDDSQVIKRAKVDEDLVKAEQEEMQFAYGLLENRIEKHLGAAYLKD